MDLNEIWIFTKVVQAGSFTGASKLLGIPKSTVSTKVAQLEKRLGVSLLHRTTRRLHVTEAGDAYFRTCAKIFSEIQEAENGVTQAQVAPRGLLRVTAPVEFGTHLIAPIVHQFMKKYEDVEIDLLLTDRIVDLVGEGFDLAIRAGELEDSSLKAKKLGMDAFQLFATPAYLKKNGMPTHPKQLGKHCCLRFTAPEESSTWYLESGREKVRVEVKGRFGANNLSVLRELVLKGAGIGLLPLFLCADDVKQGRLVRVLPEWTSERSPVHAVYAGHRFVPQKVHAFIQVLTENMGLMFEK